MTSAYLGKMCVHILKLLFFKYNENSIFLFKNTYNKGKSPYLIESDKFYYVFYGCPCFLNMVMDNVYDKQLKSKGPEN